MEGRKEGNVLFNDIHNTFYLRLCGVGHMVKAHSDSERGSPLPPHGLTNGKSSICSGSSGFSPFNKMSDAIKP